jgi:hypothetical protein
VTGNQQLAEQLRRQADDATRQRRALLCASVALATTTSVPAAIRVLHEWDGPEAIKTAAADLLGDLSKEAPE